MNPGNYRTMGIPQMGMQMGQPPMGMSQAPMGQQHMGNLQMSQPHMVQQQVGQPQMGQQTPLVQRQMGHMNQSQTANPAVGVQQQIVAYLQAQQTPMGWQQTYRIENRLAYILQIITQLSLLQLNKSNTSPLTVAVEYERREFEISPDQMTYDRKCREKLQELLVARQTKQRGHQNQAAVQSSQLNMNNQQIQHGAVFNPQPQLQQSQGYMQQPVSNQTMLLQQQQQAQQQAQMQMRNGVVPASTNGRNPSQQVPPTGNDLQITQQDQQQIENMTQNMMNNMSQQGRMHLEQAIMNMAPQIRQNLTEKGTDLYRYMIRQKATQSLILQKSRINAQTASPAAFPSQPSTSIQAQQGQQFDQLGNIDQIRRAQQDALHHQQEGQVVVPATGQRPGNPQRAASRVQKTPQQAQPAAFAGNRPMQAPNQTPQQPQSSWSSVQKQTPNMQQTPQLAQAQNFPQPQQNSLQSHRTSQQQHPGLNTLNQPMDASQNVPSPGLKQQSANIGQRMTNGQLPPNQGPKPPTNMPQRAVLPPAMQQHLNSLKTEEDKKHFIMMLRRQQLQRQQQAQKGNLAQQPQGQTPQTAPNVRTPVTAGQPSLPQGNPVRPNDPQAAFRQGLSILSESQEKQMDNMDYPETILNTDSILAQVPGDVKSWAQLKSWVNTNANRLPPDSLQKLKQLQAKHFNMKMNEARKVTANRGTTNGGPAPAAQMFPNGNAPQQPPKQPSAQPQPPTMQEVQQFRASLPKANVMSDEQIRLNIMSRKRSELMNSRQNPQLNAVQNQQMLQQQYNNMMKAQQAAEQARLQGSKPTQPPQRGSQPTKKQVADQAKTDVPKSKTPQQQGVKRTSNDDVVEVQDPKLLAQHQQPPRQPQIHQVNGQPNLQQQQLASVNRLTPAQIDARNQAQKAQFEHQRRGLIAQPNQQRGNSVQHQPSHIYPQPNPVVDGTMGDTKFLRLKQLREEVTRSMPPRQPVSMSQEERAIITQKLRESKNQFIRITQSLHMYLSVTHDEARVKDVIRTHALLSRQVRDIEHNPIENFTITYDEFTRAFNNLQQYMADMANIFQQMQRSTQQNKQVPPAQQPHQPKSQALATPQTQQLSAANLQQQQAALDKRRVATMKTNNNKPPAAPTTSHVPFAFGSQSPQGVPQIYVAKKNELTQEKLQLPVPKKQKKNQAQTFSGAHASSPVKIDSPEAQRLPATPTTAAFKCPERDCKVPPFASKALLEKHTKDVHEVKDEHITDPLEYVLGGLRMALNLDEKGQSKYTEANIAISKAPNLFNGAKGIKQELVSSPASKTVTGLNTERQSKTLTPASKDISQSTTDRWISTSVPQHWFGEVFRDVADPNRALSNEFLASWLDVQAAPELSTDDDSPQSADKASSHKSDISATDNIDITIVGEDGFLTENWFDIAGDMNALEVAGLTNMDWDADMEVETMGSLGKRADGDTSDEWLKVYAPERYSERVKAEKKPVR